MTIPMKLGINLPKVPDKRIAEKHQLPSPIEPSYFHRAALIYNPLARRLRGRRVQKVEIAMKLIRSYGLEVEAYPTKGPNHASLLAREVLDSGCDLIIACGGDGTINEVIRGIAGSQGTLMIIPAGTSNVLAKEVGLPSSITHSVSLIRTGIVRRISLGQVDGRHFALMAGIGLDASVVSMLSERLKTFLGEGAFWIEGFRQLFAYSFSPFQIQINGKSRLATFALISKARYYGGGVQITGRANFFSDNFDVCLFQSNNRWRYLYYLWMILLRQHYKLPDMQYLKARTIRLVGSPTIKIQVDGELIGHLPQNVTIHRDALSLLVPKPKDHHHLTR